MDKSKIIILDFLTGELHIHEYDKFFYDDAEDFLNDNGYSVSNCQYMVIEKLKLTIH